MAWPENKEHTAQDLLDSDAAAGFEITDEFERFNQMDDIFTRAFWDPEVKSDNTQAFFSSYRMEAAAKRAAGFSQRDFALRNASWVISDIVSGRGEDRRGARRISGGHRKRYTGGPGSCGIGKPSAGNPRDQTDRAAVWGRFGGHHGAGYGWHYSKRPDTRTMTPVESELPKGLSHVIVMGHSMDFDLVDTYPSALAGAATGREYSHEAAICIQLAAYIRNLGFQAVASMNDTALVIPYAIKAGLGEYGRNQMVLTPKYGPRVRFSKIFTDMPLAIDEPRKLGLAAYCEDCTVCADACPPKALPFGAPDLGAGSRSTVKGVKKWSANCEACFGYWAKIRTDCAICMRVCPFNRRGGVLDRLWLRLATGRGRWLARWWLGRSGKREPLKPVDWWGRDQV